MSHRSTVTIRSWTLCFLVSLLAAGTAARTANAQAKPLVQQNNLTYRGAFRLPEVPYGVGFDYAQPGLAYYPAHDSLFINNQYSELHFPRKHRTCGDWARRRERRFFDADR